MLTSVALVAGHLVWVTAFRLGNAEAPWGPLLVTPLVSAALTVPGRRVRSYVVNAISSGVALTIVLAARVALGGGDLFDRRPAIEALTVAVFATAGAGAFALTVLAMRGLADPRTLRRPALCALVCGGVIAVAPAVADRLGLSEAMAVVLLVVAVTPLASVVLASAPGWQRSFASNAVAGAGAAGLVGAVTGTWQADQPAVVLFPQNFSFVFALGALGAAAFGLTARAVAGSVRRSS